MTIVTPSFASWFGGQAMEEVPATLFPRAMRWAFAVFALICSPGIHLSCSRGKVPRAAA